MKASELKEFDLSELTIDKKKYSVEDLSNLINRVSKHKKPNYIRAIEKNQKNRRYEQAIRKASTYVEPTKQLDVIKRYMNGES